MIYTLYGKVFEVDVLGGYAVIECGGVGYKITVSANTLTSLPMPEFDAAGNVTAEKNVRVYTHLAVREDGVELFGFYTKEELDAFKLLINVSGVGPKVALGVLSLFTPDKLYAAIAAEDAKAISRTQGVGAKTAARIVLELHDKVAKMAGVVPSSAAAPGTKARPVGGGKLADATDALAVLGYSRSEIAAAMKNVNMEDPLEDIIKSALAALMR